MRKRVLQTAHNVAEPSRVLPVEDVAEVEVTSETVDSPIEAALSPGRGSGWRAGTPGEQTIKIFFSEPASIRRMALKFTETARERTQEFVLTWSTDETTPPRVIVRQQWTFSPSGSTTETETFDMELDDVRVLELSIKPDLSDGTAVASLAEWVIYGTGKSGSHGPRECPSSPP